MKITDTKKFGQDIDSFLKKTKGGHLTSVNIQWVSSGEKNSSGRYFFDVLVYVNLQHGEKLAYLLTVITKEDGSITRINYPESGITVGSNTPEQIVKKFHSIPADDREYITYKEETIMKTQISQIKSIAEAIRGVLSEAPNTVQWTSDVNKVPAKIRDDIPIGAKVYVKHMGELADFYAYNDFKGGVHFWNVEKGEWTYAKNLDAAYDGHMDAMDNRTSYTHTV